ncbi:hypothetical protein ACE6H2_005481 [Prunus campanulata]
MEDIEDLLGGSGGGSPPGFRLPITAVESSSGTANTMANTMMQKFWDSALALEPPDDCDTQSELSALMASDGTDGKFPYPSLGLGNSFAFKFEDLRGRMHRINCGKWQWKATFHCKDA